MYSVLSILWIVLVYRFIRTGPAAAAVALPEPEPATLTTVSRGGEQPWDSSGSGLSQS
jgi:hypothetical protein